MKIKKTIIILIMLSVIIIGMNTNNITKAENITEEKIYCNATLDDEFTDNEILIVITNEESIKFSEYTVNSFSEINCIEVIDLTDGYEEKIEQQLNGTYEGNMPVNLETFNRILKLTLGFRSKEYVLSSIKELEKRNDILIAIPNIVLNSDTTNIQSVNSRTIQNAYHNLDLSNVWEITTGSPYVKVGVIDSGISNIHTDLDDNLNIALSKSMSDLNTGNPYLNVIDDRVFANPFYDQIGHGTKVAGVIGAEGNNNEYLQGVCWDISLVSLKSFDNSKFASNLQKVINAFIYADSEEISIVNCSFGWYNVNNFTDSEIEEYFDLNELDLSPSQYRDKYMISTSTANMLKESIENYGGLVICAASNENLSINVQTDYTNDETYSEDNLYFYPASFNSNNIVAVGSATYLPVDQQWVKSSFSNYGNAVDIYAPGDDIVVLNVDLNDNIGVDIQSGTSFAAPYISGVAALILSRYPNLTTNELKECILESSLFIQDFVLDYFDNYIASGCLVDPFAAINYHIHNFSYEFHNSLQHNCVCYCGHIELENHIWQKINSLNLNSEINAVPGSFVCLKCFATKLNNGLIQQISDVSFEYKVE